MIDAERAIAVATDALLRELGDDVDLIFRYGSLLKGTQHHYSDIDVSYVPAHESTARSITVLIQDVMLDLYPIRWPQLERMAEFDDVSCTVLLESKIIYQRSADAAGRFAELADRVRALQTPAARQSMVRKALAIFQQAGYPFYLLQQQAQRQHLLACLQQSRAVLQTIRHCLMVLNQAAIDSRKLDQMLALPLLPLDFAERIARFTAAETAEELVTATTELMNSTQDLLLREQHRVLRQPSEFRAVFDSAYPEFKGDLHHVMLACERDDLYNMNLIALYHELMVHMAQAETGVEYSSFNSIADYSRDLVALGFPDLPAYLVAGDLDGLHRECKAFDIRLQAYLQDHGVNLNAFDSVDALAAFLQKA